VWPPNWVAVGLRRGALMVALGKKRRHQFRRKLGFYAKRLSVGRLGRPVHFLGTGHEPNHLKLRRKEMRKRCVFDPPSHRLSIQTVSTASGKRSPAMR
jgi:hypothetical protein